MNCFEKRRLISNVWGTFEKIPLLKVFFEMREGHFIVEFKTHKKGKGGWEGFFFLTKRECAPESGISSSARRSTRRFPFASCGKMQEKKNTHTSVKHSPGAFGPCSCVCVYVCVCVCVCVCLCVYVWVRARERGCVCRE